MGIIYENYLRNPQVACGTKANDHGNCPRHGFLPTDGRYASGAVWMSGFGTDFGRFSSSTGNAAGRFTGELCMLGSSSEVVQRVAATPYLMLSLQSVCPQIFKAESK